MYKKYILCILHTHIYVYTVPFTMENFPNEMSLDHKVTRRLFFLQMIVLR